MLSVAFLPVFQELNVWISLIPKPLLLGDPERGLGARLSVDVTWWLYRCSYTQSMVMMQILLIREGTGVWPCYVHVLVRLYAVWPADCHPVCIISESDSRKIGKEGLANGDYGLFMILSCYGHQNSNVALKYHCQYPSSGLLSCIKAPECLNCLHNWHCISSN